MTDHSPSRREFIRTLTELTTSALILASCGSDDTESPTEPPEEPDSILPARQAGLNPFVTPDGKPILVCVEGGSSEDMINAGLAALGGLSLLIGAQESVFVKPNCNYVDSYPGVSRAGFVRLLTQAVVDVTGGEVLVGDQGFQPSEDVYPHMELESALSGTGASVIHLSNLNKRRVVNDHWDETVPVCGVYREIYDSPVIVNCCNLKRHRYASISCSLKNNVGAIMGPEMTASRRYLHDFAGDDFQRWVAEIAALIKPELSVVDAGDVLTVDGPLTAWGEIVPVGKVILCGDMVATDAYCAALLDEHDSTFSAATVDPLLQRAEELGLGTADLSEVEIVEITA